MVQYVQCRGPEHSGLDSPSIGQMLQRPVRLDGKLNPVVRATLAINVLPLAPDEFQPHHQVIGGIVQQIDLRDLAEPRPV